MIHGHITLALLICTFSMESLYGMDARNQNPFIASGKNISSDNTNKLLIIDCLNTLHLNGHFNINNLSSIDAFTSTIRRNWDKQVKIGLGQPYCALSMRFEQFKQSATNNDDQKNYEHIEASKFTQQAKLLAQVLEELAQKSNNIKSGSSNPSIKPDSSKPQRQSDSAEKSVIPDGGVFAIEL